MPGATSQRSRSGVIHIYTPAIHLMREPSALRSSLKMPISLLVATKSYCVVVEFRSNCHDRWIGWWFPIIPTTLGFFPDLKAGNPAILVHTRPARIGTTASWRATGPAVAYEMIGLFANGNFPAELTYWPDTSRQFKSVWQTKHQGIAEEYNDPGDIHGVYWLRMDLAHNRQQHAQGCDLSRRRRQSIADGAVHDIRRRTAASNPRDLWKWLTNYEATTGGDVLALAHNGNLANGIMFPVRAQYDGKRLDKEYVSERIKWEPLYEATQIKGDGEAHPFLSPEDEFADYETWDIGNLDVIPTVKTDDMLAGEYAREALKNGLALEARLGTNPYKFGMVGSTDSHTGLATAQEDNFFGKHTGAEPKPSRMEHPFLKNEKGTIMGWGMVSSGLAAVYATENTREAIFDAMERKEVYATTGSRLMVRFFGGWDYTDTDMASRNPAFAGYQKGVPMGGDLLPRNGNGAPTFMVYALKDPLSGNLDRIQIIKGWLDDRGNTHEQVYDVAWSGTRLPGGDGKLPPVGNTVDAATANFKNTIGASELGAVWADPDFDPEQRAFYYARVIEIPTPRWSTIEAFRFGIPIPEGAPVTTQERAYTSPIWYTP